MQPLIENLFVLLLTGPGRALSAAQQRAIAEAPEHCWGAALEQLAPHKVFPLLAYQLARAGLWEGVPEPARARLSEMQAEVRARNLLLMLTLARVLRTAAERGQRVLLLKGILFADSYYPDPSTRPMSDIDLVAEPGRDEALLALLTESGFGPSLHHVQQTDSVTLLNRDGVFCDAHRRIAMFAGEPWSELARPVALQRVHGVDALALEPHAMVAHLARHMAVHAPDIGFVLLWMVDLALVLRRHADALDAARIRRLIDDHAAWALLLRMVRLLQSAGEVLPDGLARAARALPPLSLATALRQRRIVPWGLPAPLGWARLLAHQLGLHRSERPLPSTHDLLLWPLDALRAKVASPLARATGH